MRIAYVCADPGVPVFGTKGSSVHVQEVIRAFLAKGAAVEIFATRFDGEPPEDLAGAGIHWLSALPKGNLAARERASLGANRGLQAMLQVSGEFDLVYERYSLWSYAGMEFARDAGIPGVLEVNAPLIEEQEKHRGLVDRSAAEQVAQRVFEAASSIIVVSEEIAKYLRQYDGTAGRVHVVPNGVNAERFKPGIEPLFPRQSGTFTIGFVGTLKPWHGLPVLAEAFTKLLSRVPSARLIIAGDGPERGAIENELAGNGAAAATTFTGPIQPVAVPALLASLDAAVAPYPVNADFYFSPLKVYEYMAAGLPVVASSAGQIASLIRDGVDGLLCDPGDASGFADALQRLALSPDLRRTLGTNARETILRAHTWPMVVDRILDIARIGVRAPSVGPVCV